MYVCMYVWSHIEQEYGSTGQGCQSCSWSAEQGKWIFPCPHSRLRTWYRETGSAVPSRVIRLISILRLNLVLRDSSRVPRWRQFNYLEPPYEYAIESVPSFSDHAILPMAFAAESPPAQGPANLKVVPTSGERSCRGHTKFEFTIDEGIGRLNASRD